MKTLMNLLVACAIIAVMSANAVAGDNGGGAKTDGTIAVANNTGTHLMVVAVAPAGTAAPATVSGLLALGAQVAVPGASVSFTAAEGNHEVFALYVNNAPGVNPGPLLADDSLTVQVFQGQTTPVSSAVVGVLTQP